MNIYEYLRGLRVKINLIPYNAQSCGRFKAPEEEAMKQFRTVLQEMGYQVLLRTTKGSSIMAACGQLGNGNLKKTEKKLGAKSLLSLL